MRDHDQRLQFLTLQRSHLRDELDQMAYRDVEANAPNSLSKPRAQAPGNWTIAIVLLLMASIFLVAFTFTPESTEIAPEEAIVLPEISLQRSPTDDQNGVAPAFAPAVTLIPDYPLFTFTGAEPDWNIVNDSVMGGISQSSIAVDEGLGQMLFSGNVSLENNGGFASARTEWTTYNLEAYDGIALRVRGDGNLYRLRLRTATTGYGLAYTAWFRTEADSWQEIYIPFDEMAPLYRDVLIPEAGYIDASTIRSFGIMVSDKQEDDFALEVDWIKAVSENQSLEMVSANASDLSTKSRMVR